MTWVKRQYTADLAKYLIRRDELSKPYAGDIFVSKLHKKTNILFWLENDWVARKKLATWVEIGPNFTGHLQ